MALGFGKKKDEAAPADAPAQEGADFDSDTFSLEAFAADLESAGSSAGVKPSADTPAPSSGSSNGDALAWDDTALLNFDDPNAFGNTPTNERRGGTQEGTPFDDLARELEDIPGLAHQFPPVAPAAPPVAPPVTGGVEPERKTRRKAVSANLSEAIAESTPLDAETGKKKKEKKEKPITIEGDKKKLPLVPIIGVAAVLLIGGGAAFMFLGGSNNSDVDESAPAMTPAAVVNEAAAPAANPAAPAAAQPPAPSVAKPPAPAAGESSPEVMAKLKALWKKGADAKHNKDYAGARAAWQEMLKLKPDNPAVKEAIEKLPKK